MTVRFEPQKMRQRLAHGQETVQCLGLLAVVRFTEIRSTHAFAQAGFETPQCPLMVGSQPMRALFARVVDTVVSRQHMLYGQATDRKFNRMRPSMARVLGLETRSAKEG